MNHHDVMVPQRRFWNQWNANNREQEIQDISRRQAEIIEGWLTQLGRKDLHIIDVGCGSGWSCPRLCRFGQVTGTDLSDEVLARAQEKYPQVNYVPGNFMELDFDRAC